MINKNNDVINDNEVRHLEDFFPESGKFSTFDEDYKEDSPLKDLKAVVLAIDWEVNDEIMTMLIEQTGKLKEIFTNDKILLLFFQLISSVGKYIKTKKVDAHQNAFKLLNSVYFSLEKVFFSKEMPEEEKKKILLVEMKKFNELKKHIAIKKTDKSKEEDISPAEIKPNEIRSGEIKPIDMSQILHPQIVAYILEEIKKVVRAEFEILKAELKL